MKEDVASSQQEPLRYSYPQIKQHTLGHIECPACEEFRAMASCALSLESPFSAAADVWYEVHSTYIKQNTRRVYRQYIKSLVGFLGTLPIRDIHIGTIRAYQSWRSQAACATRTNSEVSVLKMVLCEANLWDRIGLLYRPLPIPKRKIRQNMSEEEERRLMAVALEKPRRRVAGHCLLIMANTTMGFGELRNVVRSDVFLESDPPYIQVNGGAKNDYRIRTITLNFVAIRSVRWLLHRWEKLGGTESNQYILPHNATRDPNTKQRKGHKRTDPPDFSTPMGHIYRAARGILKDAGLSHLDPYDMRSHAITKLLSDPNVSDQVYEELSGHSGRQMRMRYSKQRLEKKKVATDGLCKALIAEESRPRLLLFPGGKGA